MAFISTFNINEQTTWQKHKETLWWNLSWLENQRIITKNKNSIKHLGNHRLKEDFKEHHLKIMSKIQIQITIALKLTIHRCISAWNINTWYISKDNPIMSDLTNLQKDQTVVSTNTKTFRRIRTVVSTGSNCSVNKYQDYQKDQNCSINRIKL